MTTPNNSCDSLVISCIDFRIQPLVSVWLSKKFQQELYDYAAFAGSVKNLSFAEKQIEVSERLHNIKQAILIAHEDCGGYGIVDNVRELQMQDLRRAKKDIAKQHPELEVHLYYLHVIGVFEEIH